MSARLLSFSTAAIVNKHYSAWPAKRTRDHEAQREKSDKKLVPRGQGLGQLSEDQGPKVNEIAFCRQLRS